MNLKHYLRKIYYFIERKSFPIKVPPSITSRVYYIVNPVSRERKRLAKKYLKGYGIEIGALFRPIINSRSKVKYVDLFPRETLKKKYPELKLFGLVKVDIIDNGEHLTSIENSSVDFIVASHMIEHCKDVISTIKNHMSKLKQDGILFYVIPDKRNVTAMVPDFRRELTPLKHFVDEYSNKTASTSIAHYDDYYRALHNLSKKENIAERLKDFIQQSPSIHFHTFVPESFTNLIYYLITELKYPLRLLNLTSNDEEFICILKKVDNQD